MGKERTTPVFEPEFPSVADGPGNLALAANIKGMKRAKFGREMPRNSDGGSFNPMAIGLNCLRPHFWRFRSWLLGAAVIAAIFAGGIALLSGRLDRFRPKIQAELQNKLKRPVTLGHLGLKLFPLAIEVQGFSIAEDAQFARGRPFASARQVFVSAGLFRLLGGDAQVNEVILNQPRIELIRNAAGKWNFSSLGGSGGDSRFALDKLEIKDGQVALTDALHPQAQGIYDHIDLTANDFSREKVFGVDLGVHLPGEGKQWTEFQDKAGPLTSSLPAVSGHLSLEQVSLAAVNRFAAGALPAQTDSVLSGGADVDTRGGKTSAKGDLEMAKTVIRGSTLDYPIKAKFALSADQTFNSVAVQMMNLTLGSTTLQASGSFNSAIQPAAIDVTVRSAKARIAELLNVAKAFGVRATDGVTGSGTLTIDLHAQGDIAHPEGLNYAGTANLQEANLSFPELTKPVLIHSADAQFSQNSVALTNLSAAVGGTNLNGTLSAAHFAAPVLQFALALDKMDTEELESLMARTSAKALGADASLLENVLTNATGGGTLSVKRIQAQQIALSAVSTTAKLDHGQITLSPLSADVFNGKISGSVAADLRPRTPDCSLNAKLSGVDANALLSAVSGMKNELYGSLGARTNLKFALASGGDLTRTLNGTVDFALANGELKNVDILGEVSKFLSLLDGKIAARRAGDSTQLKHLSGTLTIANGVATTNNLKAATDSGNIAANGSLNLVNEAVDLHMTVGTGFLAMPVLVTGTTAHMRFAPDLEALAKMKLRGVLGSIFGDRGDRGQKK